ncbi:MAG: hypothetical protein LBO70_01600 [Clostridiales Family XIII bacterium]|jgi:hypothetical protein|nr:hypothetical protein [Clostridiales Family XIII bacterium]
MLTVNLPEGYLARHERIAIERDAGNFLLPVTIVEDNGLVRLIYRTDGFVALRDHDFHGDLYRVFRTVKGYAAMIYKAQDMLLRPDRIFLSGDRVFVSSDDCGVRIVYGALCEEVSAYGAYTKALMPILAELSTKVGITGTKAAMTQLAKKMKAVNPDYEAAIRLIESVERRWNYMQPVGP